MPIEESAYDESPSLATNHFDEIAAFHWHLTLRTSHRTGLIY
jgi:hypothetical protein